MFKVIFFKKSRNKYRTTWTKSTFGKNRTTNNKTYSY